MLKTTTISSKIFNIINILILIIPLLAHAALPQSSNVPGGVALVALGKASAKSSKPQAWLGYQAVLVTADKKKWVAVVGLPLDITPGTHKLNVIIGDEMKVQPFEVKPKNYPEQHITIQDKGKVELSPENEARAVREITTIKQIKLHWRDAQDTDLAFMIPAKEIGRAHV